MDTEVELIQKYEHVMTTVREQIRGLKTRVSGRRLRESPFRGNIDTDPTRSDFKEELVRKEFELEECLLELDELKSELRRQKDSPFPASVSPPAFDEGEPQPNTNPAYPSWEDLPVREDLSRGSQEERESDAEGSRQEGEVDLLRQKVDIIERENRVLREKADLYDSEIQSLQSRLQRSLKQGLLRRSQFAEDCRPSIQHLRREVKDELNRELVTPRSTRLQKKIETLQESVMVGCGEEGRRRNDDLPRAKSPPKRAEVTAIAQLLVEKEAAIQDMTTRLDTLAEEYQSMLDSKAAREMQQERELDSLRNELREKEDTLEDIRKQFAQMEERVQAMVRAREEVRPESQPVETTLPRLDTDPDRGFKATTEASQGKSPDPRLRQTALSTMKPLVNAVKEAVGRQTMGAGKVGIAGKLAGAMKGKVGPVKVTK